MRSTGGPPLEPIGLPSRRAMNWKMRAFSQPSRLPAPSMTISAPRRSGRAAWASLISVASSEGEREVRRLYLDGNAGRIEYGIAGESGEGVHAVCQ